MDEQEIEEIEFDLLLEGVFRRYGYDFRNYARASIKRRLRHFAVKSGCVRITELTLKMMHDPSFFQEMVADLSVPVTEMFRDPEIYLTLRREVMPYLATYPFIKVWHAGCASGEEVYSLAVLLQEEGLYARTTIYATDFNEAALAVAREGIYPIDRVKEYSANYQKAGGRRSFSDYYLSQYDSIIMAQSLKKNITFARHNLVTDQVFGEMHLIMCRNVLIYFNRTLQEQVLHLVNHSLIRNGFLCLGSKESLCFSEIFPSFSELEPELKIYRKKIEE